MTKKLMYIVDVFTKTKYSGNQLAVFRHMGDISSADMQKIALEMNYPETTFILSEEEVKGGFDVRIFTPKEEVPFAGHPTLGTAYIIQQEILKEPVKQLNLNLKIGQIPVSMQYKNERPSEMWMTQVAPKFGDLLDSEQLTAVLGLAVDDFEESLPIQIVNTGIPFIIVPLKSLDAVKRARIHSDAYYSLIKQLRAKAILVFAPETYHPENTFNARMFADYYGVPEDPATGSANGCLAGYLCRHRYFGGKQVEARVEQGYEIRRPSLLLMRADERGGKIRIEVGGSAVLVAKGHLV